jgi:FixJ family two-component response regulator
LGSNQRGIDLRTVHLVDDDISYLAAMKRRLAMAGFNVLAYTTAVTFLEREDDGQGSSCLVVDVEMPGMGGLELQERLREQGSILPILFVSGCPNERIVRKAIEAGAVDFLAKPISSDQLIGAINAAMAGYETVRPRADVSRHFMDELFERAAAVIIEARMLREQNRSHLADLRLGVSFRKAHANFLTKNLSSHQT